MDIQRKCFEESNNVNPDWSFKFDEELQQYIALDSEMELQVDEFNEHWDTFRAGWQAAKAQEEKKLEGCVVVPLEATEAMYQAYEKHSVAPMSTLSKTGYKAMLEAAQEPANE